MIPGATTATGGDTPSRLTWAVALTLLGAALVLPFYHLGERDLWSSHEARAAMDARSLLDPLPGQPVGVPHMDDGTLELQKPPTFYWAVAGVAWLRGGEVDALAVRLPAALSAAGVAAAVGLALAFGFGRPFAGAVAALALMTGIHFPWLARIGRIDMPMTLTVTLSALAFALGMRGGRRRLLWLTVAYAFGALGVLLKGPIGLVLPGAVVVAWLLERGEWPAIWEGRAWLQLLQSMQVIPGLLLVLGLVAPLYVWLDSVTEGQFGREFLWYHNWTRGLGGSQLRSHPVYLHLLYFLLYFLPFSPLVAIGLLRFRWHDDRLARLGIAWLVGVLIILSAARFKRADYLAPAYPGAAIFLGCLCERCLISRRGVLTLAGIALAGWGVQQAVYLPGEEMYRDYRTFSREVRDLAPVPAEIHVFRTEAHALVFHLGRPVSRLVEWDKLHSRLKQPGSHLVVLPPTVLDEARLQLPGIDFAIVGGNTNPHGPVKRHERPLLAVRATQRQQSPGGDR